MRGWAPRLLLLAVSVVVSLLLGEVACRLFLPQIGWHQLEDRDLGWASREYLEFDPMEDPRGDQTTRILFLGDSFIAGSGVSALDKRFPALLGDRLGRTTEVRILASAGWGTDQQLLAFIEKGRDWRPDLVILAFCANNDISNIVSHAHVSPNPGKRQLKPYFVLENGDLRLYDGHGEPVVRLLEARTEAIKPQLYLLDLVRYLVSPARAGDTRTDHWPAVDSRYKEFSNPRDREPEEISSLLQELSWSPEETVSHTSAYIHEDFRLNSYQWKLLESILSRLNQEVEAVDARLVTLLLPTTLDPWNPRFLVGSGSDFRFETPTGGFTFRTDEPRDRLRDICERLQILFFDPTEEFHDFVTETGSVRTVWPSPDDRHFSDRGHEIMADLLQRYLSNSPEV